MFAALVSMETIGDYCYAREARGVESFNACMRAAEDNSGNFNIVFVLLIAGVIAAVYFYNKGKSDSRKEGAE
jgi:hypothetical protein